MVSANGHHGYRLDIGRRALRWIERLRDVAIARRVGRSYTEDLDAVLLRLARDPHGWGRLVEDIPKLGLTRRRGRSTFLTVLFSIDHRLRVVYVHRVRANPRGPLA
jgi:hypothetical protein